MITTAWADRLAGLAAGPVDVHTHLIDIDLPDVGTVHPGAYPTVERRSQHEATIRLVGRAYREIDERSWSSSPRLRDMDAEGVAVQVVSPIPVTLCHGQPPEGAAALARAQNDHAARFVESAPDRFLALGCVPLQDPDRAIPELRRCVLELGMAGVEIGTRVGDLELSDSAFASFFAAASDLGAVLLVHPVDETLDPRLARLGITFGLGMPGETATAAAGLLTHGTFDAAPDAQVVLAHGGGVLPAVLPRLARGQRLTDTTVAPADLVTTRARRLWADSLTYDLLALTQTIARFGAGHVVLGTDYPFAAREVPPGAVLTDLDHTTRAACSHGNAHALFAAVGRRAAVHGKALI